MNVDLCFVPATREETAQKLPAVSGSSGRLVIEQPAASEAERQWPGQVFAEDSLDYEQAMLEFVAASQVQAEPGQPEETTATATEASPKTQKQALCREEAALRDKRRVVRQQRKQEDAAWKGLKAERREQKAARQAQACPERSRRDEAWRAVRQQRREMVEQRKQEDACWREKRNSLRERLEQLPIVTAWIAILVITDNCTRQCLGLPLFVAGAKVTAEMVVEALRVLLPPELRFLISDRGTHFTAKAFQTLACSEEFIHVLIARHRPESNGIAERFVRTLKEWLTDRTWRDDQELAALLEQFLAEYNDRPHQGLPISGLSPNEFAKRIWLM